MRFDFDPDTSEVNQEMHGIDFQAVQALWDDPDLLLIPVRTEDEPRLLAIGRIAGKHWSVIIPFRDEAVRLIAARRSRKSEVLLYEG